MKLPIAAGLFLSLGSVCAQEAGVQTAPPPEPSMLGQAEYAAFEKKAIEQYRQALSLEKEMQPALADERVLVHLPKRGFPYLAALISRQWLSSGWMGEVRGKSSRQEEVIAEQLLLTALAGQWEATRNACIQIAKDLAPTPAASQFEEKAKAIYLRKRDQNIRQVHGLQSDAPIATEADSLKDLQEIRSLFTQLADLPKLTPAQLVEEGAQNPALARREYEESFIRLPASGKEWSEDRKHWQQTWNHEGYLVAASLFSLPESSGIFGQFTLVINERGGVFEWNRPYAGSHEHPDSILSEVSADELRALREYLEKLPASQECEEASRVVVSSLRGDKWVTGVYRDLPGNPFPALVQRMIAESQKAAREEFAREQQKETEQAAGQASKAGQ